MGLNLRQLGGAVDRDCWFMKGGYKMTDVEKFQRFFIFVIGFMLGFFAGFIP